MDAKSDTVFGCFKPIWVVCLIFGLHCYEFKPKSRYCRNMLEFFQKYLHGIIVFALAIFLTYKCLIIDTAHLGSTNIIRLDVYFRNIAKMSSMAASSVFGWRKQNKLFQTINKMQEIETKLKKLSSVLSYKSIKIFVIFELVLVFLLGILHFALILYKYDNEDFIDRIFTWLIHVIAVKVSQLHMIEFCTLILILKQQLIVLNTTLKAMRKDDTNINDNKRLVTLKQIKKLHLDITQTCKEVNNIFSIPLLMKFLCEFVIIFTTIHYFTAGYTYKSDIGWRKIILKYYLVVIFAHPPLYEMVVIMIVCEAIYTEHRSTGKLINLFETSKYRECFKAVVIFYLNN